MDKIINHIVACMVQIGVRRVRVYWRDILGGYVIGFGDKENGKPGWVWTAFYSDHQTTPDPDILWHNEMIPVWGTESQQFIEKCCKSYDLIDSFDVRPIPGKNGFVKVNNRLHI